MASCSSPAAIMLTSTHRPCHTATSPSWGASHVRRVGRVLAVSTLCYISFRFLLWWVCVSTPSRGLCNTRQGLSVRGCLAAVQTLFGWSTVLLMWSVNESGQLEQTGPFFSFWFAPCQPENEMVCRIRALLISPVSSASPVCHFCLTRAEGGKRLPARTITPLPVRHVNRVGGTLWSGGLWASTMTLSFFSSRAAQFCHCVTSNGLSSPFSLHFIHCSFIHHLQCRPYKHKTAILRRYLYTSRMATRLNLCL